jgi:DNA-binding SARP family transcriptional activator
LRATFFLEQDDVAAAMATVDRISQISVSQDTGHIFFLRALVLADCALAQNRKPEMMAHLKAAFADAAANGLMMPLGLGRERLATLLSEAINAGIETDVVTTLIDRLQLTPAPVNLVCQAWPWPIKVVTLGRFDIYRGRERLAISKKTPKKPLELLTVLICKSGRSVNREAIMDQLWPEADGDRAVQSLNTTVHRLRKLLGHGDSLTLAHGRLRLNRKRCWVDAWQFEAMIAAASDEPHPDTRMDRLSQAIALYNGAFAGSEDGGESGTWYAQWLQSKWVDAVSNLGRLYMENDRIDQAKALFEDALAIDDTVAPIYRALVALLQDQGRLAEAQGVAARCQRVLADL